MLLINTLVRLDLGIKDENHARDLYIDMNAWYKDHPNGTISIWHKRSGDETKYAASGVTFDRETGILKWTPDAYDTFYVGKGLAEIRLTENSVIKKTKDIYTEVARSLVLGSGETMASGWQSFLNQIESDKNAVMQAIEDAEDSAEDAEAWAVGKRGGEDVESTDPAYHNNSKYYAGQAASSATDAATAQDLAEDAQEAAETAQGKAEDAQDLAEAARDAAQAAVLHYPYVDPTTGNWMVWDATISAFVNTNVHAQGPTGAVPAIAVGTVTTLQPGSSATVERRSGSPDTAPIFDFGIPKGDTGSLDNAYGTTIPMSDVDGTKIATAIGNKADKVSSAVTGDFAGLDANGNLTDSGKKAKDFENRGSVAYVQLDNIAGRNYSIGDYITQANGDQVIATAPISTGDTLGPNNTYPVNGGVANDLNAKKVNKTDFYGTEMEIVQGSNTSVYQALSDNSQAISKTQAGIAIVNSGDTAQQAISSGQYVFIKNHSTLATGLYHATAAIANGASISSSNVAADADGVANALNANLTWELITYTSSTTDDPISVDLSKYRMLLLAVGTLNALDNATNWYASTVIPITDNTAPTSYALFITSSSTRLLATFKANPQSLVVSSNQNGYKAILYGMKR